MRLTYEVVRVRGQKRGKCSVCGKFAVRATAFEQTINPFNKNAAGIPKSRAEITDELLAERRIWLEEPVQHSKC